MNASNLTAITHLVIVLALLVVFVLTGDREVLTAALGYIAAGGVGYAAAKAA
jgi:lipoprotein signal peptidase